MSRERYVLLGLARPRVEWFRTLGQWATSAVIPAEFVRCVSTEELRARLRSGRPFSAVVLDGGAYGLDRDLVADAVAADCAVIVVDDQGSSRDWKALGAAGVLAPGFDREELLEALAAHANMVGAATLDDDRPAVPLSDRKGLLFAVTGTGGTGASTVAMALAQGLAQGEAAITLPGRTPSRGEQVPGSPPTVLLADLCRAADQAMLHDSRVVVPGLQEVVESHRAGTPDAVSLREQTFDVAARGYRLLLGLRRPRHWVTIRPRALEATLDSLQSLFDVVVADVEPDVEGESETGSVEVEERHLLSRASLARASVVVIVGHPTMKGMFSLVRLANELLAFGVPVERLLPILNQAPRNPRVRAELTATFNELVSAGAGLAAARLAAPTYLPERRVDEALRDGVPLPKPLCQTLARAAAAVLDRAGDRPDEAAARPQPVVPGTLSAFTSQERPTP